MFVTHSPRLVTLHPQMSVSDLSSSRELQAVIVEHEQRGVRLQIALRAVLATFLLLTAVLSAVEPARHTTGYDVVAGAYAAWTVALSAWSWSGRATAVRFLWLALFVDLAALCVLTVLAGSSAHESWTSYVVLYGFFLVPLIAATQLRPEVSATIVVPTVIVYFIANAETRSANGNEPWASILLHTFVLAGVGLGCVGLSWIQRSRVATIVRLVRERTELLTELVSTEDRERRALAENLHDGALQYVLSARHDLEFAYEHANEDAFVRADQALVESSRLLRSTVTELHPAVLEQAGLGWALRELAQSAGASGGFPVALDVEDWDEDLRTPVDGLLYTTARELLSNVVKHADAASARISLAHEDGQARLVVADDGRGIPDGAMRDSLGHGHIGLASHRVRIEAAGGELTVSRAQPSGTVALVELPCEQAAGNGSL